MLRSVAVALVLAVLSVTGCGKSDSSSGGSSSGGSGGGSSTSAQKTPEEAVKEFKVAAEAGDAKALWNGMSKKTRNDLVEKMGKRTIDEMNKKGDSEWEEAAKDLGKPAAELKKLSAEEFTQMMMGREMTSDREKERAKSSKIDKVETRGDIAVAFSTRADGKKKIVALVKEDGTWKMDMEETKKLSEEEEKLNATK
ncbi:MAG: hypothetical protein FD180_725 [Planctomycetota bacterium]|nr:MAG: hypothetical protein FD180_725 [Planctomycetota bacterium]